MDQLADEAIRDFDIKQLDILGDYSKVMLPLPQVENKAKKGRKRKINSNLRGPNGKKKAKMAGQPSILRSILLQ